MKALTALSLCATLSACDSRPWMGWVYPDRYNLREHVTLGPFGTYEQCHDAATKLLEEKYPNGDHECGFMCRKETETDDQYLCAETLK